MPKRFSGRVELLQAQGEPVGSADCELVVDALDLGIDEWEGVLKGVSPPTAVQVEGRYLLRLPGGSQGEILITKAFAGGVWQFLGQGPPPEVPS